MATARRTHIAPTTGLQILIPRSFLFVAILSVVVAVSAWAQEPEPPESNHTLGFEAKVHYRDSDEARFGVRFPFSPSMLPVGQSQGFLETVEPGTHFEASTVTLWYKGTWDEAWGGGVATKIKVDLIDRYDRNPTSTDDEWDVDEAWLRWGPETEPGNLPDYGFTAYLKLGKFPKFERQDDRHLESYGLVTTAFNRMEDIGIEIGSDLGRFFYTKVSYTEGNPLFLRDPNALAGDNGIPELLQPNPNPELKTGIAIPYDADVAIDDVGFEEPEIGVALGARMGDDAGFWNLDVMAFLYSRDLADTREFEGSFYGGDLDLLLGPLNAFPFAVRNRTKEEIGLNVWLYAGGLSIFGQYVDQDLGGLSRDGFEIEVAYDWELPWAGTLFGRQLFPFVAPAIRYSELNPDFPLVDPSLPPITPSPAFNWDWQKLDLGIRLGILTGLDLTVEYAENEFVRAGQKESADELMATLRFDWDWSPGQ
ncbi:MAG: hypothetical protein MPN21_21990 [Thermoanaerobaculia bacterium]|nr:hypothetical protein [Thermoanaerobaculia bacterium]